MLWRFVPKTDQSSKGKKHLTSSTPEQNNSHKRNTVQASIGEDRRDASLTAKLGTILALSLKSATISIRTLLGTCCLDR
jgi:hypothetical protein